MVSGFQMITRWFGQQVEFWLGPQNRRFDREKNSDIMRELHTKVDELGLAVEMGMGVKEAAVKVGAYAMMLAYNGERGYGEDKQGEVTPRPDLPPAPALDPKKPDEAPPAAQTEVVPPPPPPGSKVKPRGRPPTKVTAKATKVK
jgi:hypothetical protein